MPAEKTHRKGSGGKPVRARDLGIPLKGKPGRYNAITDVAGVQVGHSTIIEGEGAGALRTGVTGILVRPRGNRMPVRAAFAALNGNGECTGLPYLKETGKIWGAIALTETLSVGRVHDALAEYLHTALGQGEDGAALPVVAETWPGLLSDGWARPVKDQHLAQALDRAKSGPVEEGGVGGGTGSVCFQYKGGIGTASRVVGKHTVGVLVQANYGKREDLTIAGISIGEKLREKLPFLPKAGRKKDGSIIVVIATDAPLTPTQLEGVAKRAGLGIGKTGGIGRTSSGDLFLAFSTARSQVLSGVKHWPELPDAGLDAIYGAAIQATEEAILNAVVAGRTMTGRDGNTVYGMPHDEVKALFSGGEKRGPRTPAARAKGRAK